MFGDSQKIALLEPRFMKLIIGNYCKKQELLSILLHLHFLSCKFKLKLFGKNFPINNFKEK